jgi:hypothetical protein
MLFEEFTEGRAAAPFSVGDPVIITGDVEYQGRTGDVREIGRDGAFVVVDLYNYGPYSFHSSDVSYNDYADSEDELNEFALDDGDDPTEDYPCWDCGSTIFLHHTKLCDLAEPNAKRDLPAEPGTQYWTGEIPKGLAPIPGLAESTNEDSATKKLSGATPAPAPNPYLKDILMRHIDEVRHFVNTGYIDPTKPMFQELYEYFANEIPDSVRRNPARLERRIGDMIAPHAKFYAIAQSMNEQGVAEEEKVGNMPADKFDDAMARLKKLAGAGPLKTVWDPQKRVYKNVPTAVQPQTQPKK